MRAFLLAFLAIASVGDAARVSWLTGFDGVGSVSAIDVSSDGRVVLGGIGGAAALWRDGVPSVLPFETESGRFDVYGLSPDGETVVGHGYESDFAEYGVYRSRLGAPLEKLAGPNDDDRTLSLATYGLDVSRGGLVVSGSYPLNGGGAPIPARWTAEGGWQALAGEGAEVAGFAHSISADGTVIAGESTSGAFRWTESGGFRLLGSLPGGTGFSYADALSDDGRYVAGTSDTRRGFESFLWSEEEGLQSLYDLTPDEPFFELSATAVSNNGVVVGFDWLGDPLGRGPRGFVWDRENGLRFLDSFLPPNQYATQSESFLQFPSAITPDGRTIVGGGSNGGWVLALAIPEPGSAVLLLIAAAGAGVVRR